MTPKRPPAPVFVPQSAGDPRATEHRVPMRDGTLLATDVYLPDPALGPVPAVLIRLPYDKTGRYTFVPQIGAHFAAHGFAAVAQDVRGKYRSGGAREPFVNEADDGSDTLDWIVAQPWSSGSVGTWGDSYYGFTQWALASRQHPAHRAMVPRVTGHRFFDMSPGGGLPTLTLLDWIVDAWAVRELIVENGTDHSAVPACDMVHESIAGGRELLRDYLERLEDPEAMVRAVFPAGNPAECLTIPALHTGGWFDNLHYWQLDDWEASQKSPAAAHQFLRMGSNDHEDYRWRPEGTPRELDFGLDADALARHIPTLLAEPISFFSHYLRGGEGIWEAPRVRYELAGVADRESSHWPPLSASRLAMALTSSGELVDVEPGGEHPAAAAADGETVTWLHDPEHPVPRLIGSEWDQNRAGLPDERALALRPDTAAFDAAPREAAWNLVGRVAFTGVVSAPTARTTVVARLYDVDPRGRATLILSNAVDAVADGTTPFSIRLGDTAYRMRTGHHLRLQLSTSLAGQYPVHPGTDEPVWQAVERRPALQELHVRECVLDYGQDPG